MIVALLEVLQDLWRFVLDGFGLRRKAKRSGGGMVQVGAPGPSIPNSKAGGLPGQSVYVRVPVAAGQLVEPSPQSGKAPQFFYGELVRSLRTVGDRIEVERGGAKVWIAAAAVTDDPGEVFPSFTPLTVYSKTHETSRRVRQCLQHWFPEQAESFLTPEAFVLYRLFKERVAVPWAELRAKLNLSWYQRLLGKPAVRLETEPRTAAVLEYVNEAGEFRYGYVSVVHPDLTILLESVGRIRPGEYRVEEVARAEWESWRPAFITFC